MNKESLAAKIIVISLLVFLAPVAMLVYFDNQRVTQLNVMQSKIAWAENQKEVDVVKAQLTGKAEEVFRVLEDFNPASIEKKYGPITGNMIIRNSSYTNKAQLSKIESQFTKSAKTFDSATALLMTNGNVIAFSKPELKNDTYKSKGAFLQAVSSKKTTFEYDFSEGFTYFMPVTDVKDRLVSVMYVKEDVAQAAAQIRKNKQSPKGTNFVIDMSGTMALNSDKDKENSENILSNGDIKVIISEATGDIQVKEAEYNNLRGLIAYKKDETLELITCVFTPYIDYKFMQKKTDKFNMALLSDYSGVPLYVFLIIWLIGGMVLLYMQSGQPFAPIKKIIKALTHIDEESFQEMLPRIKSGEFKKLNDSLVILRGRVKASEEKANKLSTMSKELEEELSKEASKADAEISELRDALKIAENNKAGVDEEIAKAKNDIDKVKKEADVKLEAEKSALKAKITMLEKDSEKLKEDAKKASETKVPLDKENMRMDSVLMMNTELKGVLSVIKTYISSVLGGEGKITDAQQQFLGVVINKSARLERLINDLTELSRLEKGEIKLIRQPMEINTVVQDVVFAIQPQADIKKVDLKINFSPASTTAAGDSSRLASVTSQLLNQAIKVSPRGGQVIVETRDNGKDVLIRISDFGMSMPQAKAGILFVNFHGPESTAGPEFINSGLRFPILKAVVNNMGGEIWIESEIGKGKTFVMSIPKAAEGLSKPAEPAPAGLKTNPTADAPKPPEIKSVSAQPAGFKIQHNNFMDMPSSPSVKKDEQLPTVNDLLSFDNMSIHDKKVDMPGRNVTVPDNLLKIADVKKSPGATGTDKKTSSSQLPFELPPLPDLEDDKA
jgi:signal transduction histidine kinase